ncbi:MAG TPA: hypothetical protein VF524_09575, partial [Polyangia bacterium]
MLQITKKKIYLFTFASYLNTQQVVREPRVQRSVGQLEGEAPMMGAKVFTATKAKDRDELGEVLTRWIHDNPKA